MIRSLPILLVYTTLAIPTAHAEFPENRNYVSGTDLDQDYGVSLAGSNKVVLTYDDGPDEVLTPQVLDLLKANHFTATFFLIGENITEKTKPIIIRALKEGHLIGSHSMHHLDSNAMTEDAFRADLNQSITVVRDLIQESGVEQNEVYFRFPYGNYGAAPGYHHFNVLREESQKIFGGNCINFVFWSIDPSDGWGKLNPNQLFKNVFSAFDGGRRTTIDDSDGTIRVVHQRTVPDDINHGGVILMHDIKSNSVQALPRIYAELNRRKIQVVPLNSMPEFNFTGRSCGKKEQPRIKP